MLLLLLAGAALTGCQGRAEPALRRAATALQQRDALRASREVEVAFRTATTADDRASAYYLRAQISLQQGRAYEARSDLEAALGQHPSRPLSARIQVQLANLDFEEGRYASAARRYEESVEVMPKKPPKDRVLMQYAASLQRTGRFREGEQVLRKVLQDFPGSVAAAQAARKLQWGMSSFTVQSGVFRDESTARSRAGALRSQGLPARVVRVPASSSSGWAVHCGNFSRYTDAERCLADVRKLCADAFILP